jgi:Flp pilus assembly protein CpaB
MSRWDRLRFQRQSDTAVVEPARDGHAVALRIRDRIDAPPAHPRERRRNWLLQPLSLIGFALVLVALVGYLALYAQASRRTAVLIAARSLAAGATIRSDDLRVARIAADKTTLAGLLPASQVQVAIGRRLQTGVATGSPLARAALGRVAATPASFTLVVPVLHALGGDLRPGDRVSVLATYDRGGTVAAQTQAIARDLLVEAVGQPPAGISSSTAEIAVTVALPDPSLASALALANSDAKIDLLQEGSHASTAAIPAVRAGSGG